MKFNIKKHLPKEANISNIKYINKENKKMSKLTVFILTFISFSLVAFAQPKFTIIGGNEYNWGEVRPKDSPLKATIEFKNEGDEDLVIIRVAPGCGCTVAKPDKDTLKPNETTSMGITYNVSTNTGVTSKSIRIETNDPNRATTNYRITANVVRDIILKPAMHLAFRELRVGEEGSATVYMKNNSNANITFSDLRVEPPLVKLTIPATFTLNPGQEIEITGRITPKETGYMSARIIFTTNHPEHPTFEIPAYGNVASSPILNN